MSNKRCTFYVVTHKKIKYRYPKDYQIINVKETGDSRGIPCDEGFNIKEKNPSFCELTALYWIWKNDKTSDFLGLEHYRRIFTRNLFSNSKLFFLNSKKVNKYLSYNDIITTKLYVFNKIIFENRLEFCYEKDMILLEQTIKEISPDYYDTYKTIMNGHRSFLCNMFITSRKILNNYCEWLFDVLFALEKKIDTSDYPGNFKRIYGYMGEVLLTVFIFKKKLKFYECEVANLENSLYKKTLHFLKTGRRK